MAKNDQREQHRDEHRDSGRILDRVAREADSSSFAIRAAQRARDHVAASDVDRDDPVEVWGTRIGRVLGLVLMVGLLVWLVVFVTRSA